jgi:hypothetical protein
MFIFEKYLNKMYLSLLKIVENYELKVKTILLTSDLCRSYIVLGDIFAYSR